MNEKSPSPNSPEDGAYNNMVAVFGIDRLTSDEGHEATDEDARELLQVITTLCRKEEAANVHHGILFHHLSRPNNAHDFVLITGTYGRRMGFGGFGNMDDALASMDYLRYEEERRSHPRPFLSPREAYTREGIFVDDRGRAMIQREVFSETGKVAINMTATKPATSEEVEEALTQLMLAVTYTDELAAKAKPTE